MKCPNCGAKIDDDSIFCTECGKKIEKKGKKVKRKKEVLKQKRPAQSNKLAMVLAIVIPVVLVGTTFGILAGLGVFSKEEAAPETIAEEQYTEQTEEYTDNIQATEETYVPEVQEATEEVTGEYISKPDDLSFGEKNITRLREHLDDVEISDFPPVSFMYPDDWIDLVCPDVSYYLIEYYPPDTERFETIEVVNWETNEYYKSLIEEGISKGDIALKVILDKLNLSDWKELEEIIENQGSEVVEFQNYGENGVFISIYIKDMGVTKSYYDIIEQEDIFVLHFVGGLENYYDRWGKYLVNSAREERLFIEE